MSEEGDSIDWAKRKRETVRSVVIFLPGKNEPVLKRIADILKRQITQRCQAAVVDRNASLTVELAVEPGIGAEGFKIEDAGSCAVRIIGNDERGLLYGVGKFLRNSHYDRSGFTPGLQRGIWVPKCSFRGIYLATHYNNFYEAAPAGEVKIISRT